MNMQSLRYFTVVAKLENMSKAAELLHVSQSSLSKSVLALETELGVSLFERKGKKLVLNDAGNKFLDSCNTILKEADDAVKDIRQMSSGADDTIRICAVGLAPEMFEFMKKFKRENQHIEYHLDTLRDSEELPDINYYDMIIYPDDMKYRKFKGHPFYSEKYFVAAAQDHDLSARASISSRALDGADFVFMQVNAVEESTYFVCSALTIEMNSVMYVDSREAHIMAVKSGLAIGFVPEGLVNIYKQIKGIKLIPLTDERFTQNYNFCFKREKHLSQSAEEFRKQFMDYFNIRFED